MTNRSWLSENSAQANGILVTSSNPSNSCRSTFLDMLIFPQGKEMTIEFSFDLSANRSSTSMLARVGLSYFSLNTSQDNENLNISPKRVLDSFFSFLGKNLKIGDVGFSKSFSVDVVDVVYGQTWSEKIDFLCGCLSYKTFFLRCFFLL